MRCTGSSEISTDDVSRWMRSCSNAINSAQSGLAFISSVATASSASEMFDITELTA